MEKKNVDQAEFLDAQARIAGFLRTFTNANLLAAVAGIGASDPSLIIARLMGGNKPSKRNRAYYAIMREFLTRMLQYLQIALADMIKIEEDTFGVNLPIDPGYSEEIKAFFDLLACNLPARRDLLLRLKAEGRFPRFLWADREATDLFGRRWIRNPKLAKVLSEISDQKLQSHEQILKLSAKKKK